MPDITLTSSVLALRFSIVSARFCACAFNKLSIICKRISLDKVLLSIKLDLMKFCCSSVEDLLSNAFTNSSTFFVASSFFLQKF
ncbi:Antigenic heat-stable 120 kDa protein [Rickettsia prowazekii str. GvF12]|nr:Antigenic heat-stable 120 kDa protein [Rickettsia prowazekii str. GvF12]